MEEYIITKKIAKHGKQAVIILPSFLSPELQPADIVEVKIKLLKKGEKKNGI